jgi:UDP-N-acetylglucosamine--N-acetylmuramyl-(pentapeptide) pyrophosphoryl-undecaprenol N-acetylglucosamine transferase
MNEAMANGEALLAQHPDVQVIWQCGKSGYDRFAATGTARLGNIRLHAFIDRMDLAYAAADVVVARAGALSISELCLVGKPAVLVPSPYVAEDHQTKNAQALVDKGAALLVPDAAAAASLLPTVLSLLPDIRKQADLGERIRMMSRPDAAREIAAAAIELARTKGKR